MPPNMINDITMLRIVAIFCMIVALVALRAWADSETVITWCHNQFHKEARLPDRFPKPSRFRKFLFTIFLLKHKML